MQHVTPAITAVVVTYNSESHVEALLDSLPAAFGDLTWETVVVDNGSTDATLEKVSSRNDCTVVHSENVGYAAGVNKGVRHSIGSGPILILNPDATLDPLAVPRMVAALERPGTGIVGPRIVEADGRLSPSMRREPTLANATGLSFTRLPRFTERIEDERLYEVPQVVDWILGAILLVSRSCYDVLGGLDESYFLYSEETDFCLRAKDMGWLTRYEPSAGAMHIGSGSGFGAKTYAMQTINRLRLYRRRNGDARAWCYLGLAVFRELRRGVAREPYALETIRALLEPSRRPAELGRGTRVLPA